MNKTFACEADALNAVAEFEKTLNPFPLLMIAPDCEPTPEMRKYGVLAPDISSELLTSPDEIFEVLESEKGDDLYGIFHCFTGTLEQAKQAISYNMKLGIGGVVTFKNGKIDQFLNQINLNHIVLETDSPYLAPAPYRGKRNESVYIIKVLEKLSEIYGLSLEEIANITTHNSKDVFRV